MSQPAVTISILNYHRREELGKVLDSVREQQYPSLETIVVDNGSGSAVTDWIQTHYPWVRLLSLPDNIGTGARNAGIAAASGDIIVTLDNDVSFDAPSCVEELVRGFQRHPQAGCIAFRVYHPKTRTLHSRDWCHPRPWQQAEGEEFETYYITEGAAAFRKTVFSHIEPYWEALWIGHEGFDLALRLMDAGYEIWYVPTVKVWHRASLETRENWRPFYFNTRNLFLVTSRNYSWPQAFMHLMPRLGVLGFYALRHGFSLPFMRAIRDGLCAIHRIRRLRRPVRKAVLRKIRILRRDAENPVARFARHWRKLEF